MSVFDNNPLTTRLQQENWYQFQLKRAPSLSYFAQTVKIPDIKAAAAEITSPFLNMPFVPDHLTFEPLVVTFQVDTNLQNWLEIFNWMNGISNSDGTARAYKVMNNNANPNFSLYSDILLALLDSQKNPTLMFNFTKAFPIDLTGPQLKSSVSEAQYLESTVTFRYLNYTINLA